MNQEPEFAGEGEGEESAQVNGNGAQVNGVDHEHEAGQGEQQTQQAVGIEGERQANKVRITTPYLTKYERARVLGTRALQIRCVIHRIF
jgi:DNA-directed RNA polymerase I, II, and III subunit RPABC2